jgi:menaquinone-dependent protoporphyrinogen IX oxidase
MRVAVIFFSGKNRDRLMNIAKGLGRGIQQQGNQVDVYDGVKDANVKLTIYQYVAVGAEPEGAIGGKVPEAVKSFLASSGIVSGKRSFAFVSSRIIGAVKSLGALMKRMEGEGMIIKNSGVLRSPVEAEAVGRKLHVS